MPISFLVCFSDCMPLSNSKALALAWLTYSASWCVTAEKPGLKEKSTAAQHFGLAFQRPQNRCNQKAGGQSRSSIRLAVLVAQVSNLLYRRLPVGRPRLFVAAAEPPLQ